MENGRLKTWLVVMTLALFGLNFTPVMAQVMEIEVIGGGYRLQGPDVIQFPNLTASLEAQKSTRDIRELDAQNEESAETDHAKDYLYISDMNGGNAFNVSVSSTDLEDAIIHKTIPKTNFYIRNKNGTGTDIVAVSPGQPGLEGVALNADTNDFASLGSEKILFSGSGQNPGSWKIFPVFQIEIPANTNPGTYVSTLTFTII